MSRYQALRRVGCGPFSAGFIAFMNWMRGVPPNIVVFGPVEIEVEPKGVDYGCKYAPGTYKPKENNDLHSKLKAHATKLKTQRKERDK